MQYEVIEVTPAQMRRILTDFPQDQVVMLWGQVGIGKTSIINEYCAQDVKGTCLIVPNSSMLPQDVRGVPVANREGGKVTATYAHIGDILPNVEIHGEKGVLFCDEFNTGTKQVMTAWQQILLTGKLGTWSLPAGWQIVCAGNRAEDLAAVNPIPEPVLDRMRHFHLNFDLDDWVDYGVVQGWDPLILGYGKWRGPSKICPSSDDLRKMKSPAKPTPRSFEMLSRILQQMPNMNPNDRLPIFSSCIGPGAARDFDVYRQQASELPSIKDLLKSPLGEKWTPPKDSSGMVKASLAYAVLIGLATQVKSDCWNRFMALVNRFPEELQVIAIKIVFGRGDMPQDLIATPDTREWVKKYGHFIRSTDSD